MPDRIRLDGRVAVVTGAAGVIGSATIKLLAERGARIVAVDAVRPTSKRDQDLPPPRRWRSRPTHPEAHVAEYVRATVDNSAPSTCFTTTPIEGDVADHRIFAGISKSVDVNVVGVFGHEACCR